MLRMFSIVLLGFLVLPFPAAAQKSQQIFDLFLQGAQQEMQRQQQRDHERQQRQHLQQLHQHFVGQWHACHGGDLAACNGALSYPYANANDRQVLIGRRGQILAAQQETAEREQRQRIEAEFEERRRRDQVEAAERERRQENARQAERDRRDTDARLLTVRSDPSRADAPAEGSWIWLITMAAGAGVVTLCIFGWVSVAGLLDSAIHAPRLKSRTTLRRSRAQGSA